MLTTKRKTTKKRITKTHLAEANKIAATAGLSVEVIKVNSVGVQGDERTDTPVLCLAGKRVGRRKGKVSHEVLAALSTKLTNELPANRVVIELTRK